MKAEVKSISKGIRRQQQQKTNHPQNAIKCCSIKLNAFNQLNVCTTEHQGWILWRWQHSRSIIEYCFQTRKLSQKRPGYGFTKWNHFEFEAFFVLSPRNQFCLPLHLLRRRIHTQEVKTVIFHVRYSACVFF